MGNQNGQANNNVNQVPKIMLKLRTRDIILHYAFKMTLVISDISIFPHQLQGLKLWDIDIILSRYVILESQRFRGKNILIFKAGVGITGVAMRKWSDAKSITMCDFRDQIVKNIASNCNKNDAKNVQIFKVNYDEMLKPSSKKYDSIVFPDLLTQGYPPGMIIDIIRKVINPHGQAILILQQNKQLAKTFLSIVDKSQFKISNAILTAQQYQASPLLNKLQGQKQFPSLSNSNYYAISLIKIDKQNAIKNNQKIQNKFQKVQIKQKSIPKVVEKQQIRQQKQQIKKQQKVQKVQNKIQLKKQYIKQQIQVPLPISHQVKVQQEIIQQKSPHKQYRVQQQIKQQQNQKENLQKIQVSENNTDNKEETKQQNVQRVNQVKKQQQIVKEQPQNKSQKVQQKAVQQQNHQKLIQNETKIAQNIHQENERIDNNIQNNKNPIEEPEKPNAYNNDQQQQKKQSETQNKQKNKKKKKDKKEK